MTKKETSLPPKLDEADKALFREAMRGVKPLVQSNKVAPPPRRTTRPAKKTVFAETNSPDTFSDFEKFDPVSSEELIAFHRPGISDKTLRKLRAGQYNVEAILDLHGMTAIEARGSLHHFLVRCQKRKARHTLIIHGKGLGKPILKNKLNHWLRQTEIVLAFCSATAKDGHSGALYVLLKSSDPHSETL
jgi:DNA-nicking Smr family endonuclease